MAWVELTGAEPPSYFWIERLLWLELVVSRRIAASVWKHTPKSSSDDARSYSPKPHRSVALRCSSADSGRYLQSRSISRCMLPVLAYIFERLSQTLQSCSPIRNTYFVLRNMWTKLRKSWLKKFLKSISSLGNSSKTNSGLWDVRG